MLSFLYSPIRWTLTTWHDAVVGLGLSATSELGWAAAILLLVLTLRLLLLPTFLGFARQRIEMLALMPALEALRTKHKGDREGLMLAMRDFQKEHSFNPFAGLLPKIGTGLVFFAVFHVLRRDVAWGRFGMTAATSGAWGLAIGLALISAVALVLTHLLVVRNSPPARNTFEKAYLSYGSWLMPLSLIAPLVGAPVGLLVYLACTNVFTTLQQVLINRLHPVPKLAQPPQVTVAT